MKQRNLKKHPSGFFVDVDAHQAWLASLPRSEGGSAIAPAGTHFGLALLKVQRFHGDLASDGYLESTGRAVWRVNAEVYNYSSSPILFNKNKEGFKDGKLYANNCFFLEGDDAFIPEQFLVSPFGAGGIHGTHQWRCEMSTTPKALQIIFVTGAQDSANQGSAIVEINGEKRSIRLHSDYSIEHKGIKVFRNGLGVFTCDGKAKELSEIVLAVQICLVIKENM